MTGTNSSNDRLILRRNVEINSNWYFFYDVFSGMKSSTTWNGNAIAQSPRKMSELKRYFKYQCYRDSPAQKMCVPKRHAAQIFMCLYAFLCAFLIKSIKFNKSLHSCESSSAINDWTVRRQNLLLYRTIHYHKHREMCCSIGHYIWI